MTLTADPISSPVPAAELLVQVRAARAERDAADVRLVELAVAWAHAHVVDPDGFRGAGYDPETPLGPSAREGITEDEVEWYALPELRWDTAASFAAANHMSTAAGKVFLRDALIAYHRLPRVWAEMMAGRVQARRVRQISRAVLGQPDDVVAHIDTEVAPKADKVGPVLLDRMLEEALLRLHAEELELDQLAALDARYVTVDPASINHTGIGEMAARADWADLAAFGDAVGAVAAALAREGCPESLDVRRSMALGILADPARAQALLDGTGAPHPLRRIILDVHLTEANLLGLDPVALDTDARPLLDPVIRSWCAREDVKLTIRPLRHCGGCGDCGESALAGPHEHTARALTDYTPSRADREHVELRDRFCAHPFCRRRAAECDLDHRVAFKLDKDTGQSRDGPTCPCNLAPACRHHHRLKTFAGWTYVNLEPGIYLWTDPYGQRFLRTRNGTVDLTKDR